MSDPHDREPVDQATIDCWRINYGLDKRTPAQAAKWWSDNLDNKAPAGAVAALGVALDELDAMRKNDERYRWLRESANIATVHIATPDGLRHYFSGADEVVDAAMAKEKP